MTYQDFDLNARYELLNRAMNQDNTLDSEVQQSLHQLDYLVYHELVNLGQKTLTPNFAKFLFPLQERFNQFKEFCEFPAITQKNIVAIGGKFSAGKSTFINNLLGKKQLAVEIDPTTSIPTYLLKGEQNQIVGLNLFNHQVLLSQDEFATLTHEEKEKYGSQVGRLLKSVFITDPDFRWENLALLDTPGYTKPEDKQQSERTDADVAHAQLNSAQFIIWLVSVEDGGIKDDDLAFLASLDNSIPKLILITKSDRKTPDEVKDIVHLTKQLLSNAGLDVENVLPVSRKLADYPLDDVVKSLDNLNGRHLEILNFGELFYQSFMNYEHHLIENIDIIKERLIAINKLILSCVDTEADNLSKRLVEKDKKTLSDFDEVFTYWRDVTKQFVTHYNQIASVTGITSFDLETYHNKLSGVIATATEHYAEIEQQIAQYSLSDDVKKFRHLKQILLKDEILEIGSDMSYKNLWYWIICLSNNHQIPIPLQRQILNSNHHSLLCALAGNIHIDDEIQKGLLTISEPELRSDWGWDFYDISDIRLELAKNPSISEEIQNLLTNQIYIDFDEQNMIWQSLAQNPNLAKNTQIKLLEDFKYKKYDNEYTENIRRYLSENINLDESVQLKLAEDKDLEVRQSLAKNPCITEKTKWVLVQHPDNKTQWNSSKYGTWEILNQNNIGEELRLEVIKHHIPRLYEDIIFWIETKDLLIKPRREIHPAWGGGIGTNDEFMVIKCLMENPYISEDIKNALKEFYPDFVLLSTIDLPLEKQLEILNTNKVSRIKIMARYANITLDIQQKLLDNDNEYGDFKELLARNPYIHPEIQKKLMKEKRYFDGDEKAYYLYKDDLLRNPNVCQDVQEFFINIEGIKELQDMLVNNPNTNEDILLRVIKWNGDDINSSILHKIAKRLTISEYVQQQLIQHRALRHFAHTLRNNTSLAENVQFELLDLLLKADNSEESIAKFLSNPSLSDNVIKKLSETLSK